MAKRGPPAQVPVYPYYIPGVPTVVPLAPSSHVEPKITSIPSLETNLAGGELRSNGFVLDLPSPHPLSSSSKSVSNP